MKHQIAAVTCSLLFLATPAMAQTTADTLRALDQCASIVDEHQRLSCFDGQGPQVKAALMRMGAHAGPPTEQEQKNWFGFDLGSLFGSSPAQQTTPDKFGSEALQGSAAPPPPAGEPPPPEALDSIAAKVTEYSYTPFGKFIIFLDNGQIWRQVEGDSDKADFHGSDIAVKISRAALGSYSLTIGDSSKTYKVKRVK
ncbi:MAG TPA: hypothetical protein VFV07_03820 [Rhizomicrobium sp.]|nr:hypothetical protein [Rhizomicrobium sp.]